MAMNIITLTDAATGATARIAPELGFNCFSFVASTAQGPRETLWAAADFTVGTARPSGSGIPLMFPFAGRIRGTSFQFQGRDFPLEAGDGQGNAIHGFVMGRPWRVTEVKGDRVVGQFQAGIDEPAILKHWPADFRITADYHLAHHTLSGEYTIENVGDALLPFAFGTHAYFRVPLGGKDAEQCRVQVPVRTEWELNKLLPTGKSHPSALAEALSQGMEVSKMRMDHVFSGIQFENHRATTSVHDPQSGHTLSQSFDDQFVACVVYNPPHREAVCVEPYTTIPDPFSLQAQGIDPHLQTLRPGQTFRTRIDLCFA